MIHNSKLRIGAFLIFILIVFFSAYFIGNFAPVVSTSDSDNNNQEEVVQDTFNKTGQGQQTFAFPLKQGAHQCSIAITNNINPEDNTPSYLYVYVDDSVNESGTKVADENAGNYEGIFNVLSDGVNTPVVIQVQSIFQAEWSVQCTRA